MLFKRILTGVMVAMMITGMFTVGASAAAKTTDYQAYAAKLDKTTYSGDDLGASYTEEATTFKVWSPDASGVKVNLYEKGNDDEGETSLFETKAMKLDKKTGVWSVKVNGDLNGTYYTYTVTINKTETETADVYAKACGVNGKRSMVVDLDSTDPEGWEEDTHILVSNATDASVWEVSVADFSSSSSSGVSEENRGKYLAFTEEGTTVDGIQGGTSTCIDYLKELGVKYVQIMPFYDFGSVDETEDITEQYNWGYDPVNYNCPEGSYSSDPYDGSVRINECKQMIQALHEAGIGVIMDVVYNHTYSTESAFQNTVPNYYYRMNDDGTFSNGSGCGNDTASEHKMFRKYMIDSVTYWASEYHIDGFRFDLMGLHDVTTMNEIRSALDNLYEDGSGKQIIMYGEAWELSTSCDDGTVLANQNNMKQLDDRIGAFDDTIRDAIKGSTDGTDGGFVQNGSSRAALKTGVSGQASDTTGWANAASQCVTYASCHDNLCLYDKLVGSVYGTDSDYRTRYEDLVSMNKLAGAIVLTSQGIPFMLSGEEFARSKDGDSNSYASSREENMIDWSNLDEYSDLVEYYKGLYQIRDAFAAFSDSTDETANNLTYISDVPDGVTGYTIKNTESGKWDTMCVIFNGGDDAQTVSVDGKWVVLADGETAGLRKIDTVNGSVEVDAHSALIMVDLDSYNSAGITADEGALVIDYYDNETKELIKTSTVTAEIGTGYAVKDIVESLTYDIESSSGDTTGEFIDGVLHAKVYVTEYEGKTSTVTFKFVDDTNGAELADSYVIRNRSGQQYFTPEIPSVEGYRLVTDNMPDNGAGKFGSSDKTVTYTYTHVTDDEDSSVCTVNVIYMDDTGKVFDTRTLTGAEGEEYTTIANEYEDMTIVSVPENASGLFRSGEINVLYSYSTTPDPYENLLIFVSIGAGVILVLCVISTVYSEIKRKRKFMEEMDVDDEPVYLGSHDAN